MSLEAYQYVLCRMVASADFRAAVLQHSSNALANLDLTELERRRLLAVAAQPGMRVNTAIHRANRLATVAQTMPLTCFLLSSQREEVFERYWAAYPTESLQLPVECERFASFLDAEIDSREIDDPYLGEIVRFERACTRLKFYTGDEMRAFGLSDNGSTLLVSVVRFRHNPVELLEALSELRIPGELESGDFYLAVDCRSGEPDFRLLDAAGVRALERLGCMMDAG